jgi:hypothetical protein
MVKLLIMVKKKKKFRDLYMNGDLPQADLGSNIVSILQQLTTITSSRESQQ